jgi:hypothetical protein
MQRASDAAQARAGVGARATASAAKPAFSGAFPLPRLAGTYGDSAPFAPTSSRRRIHAGPVLTGAKQTTVALPGPEIAGISRPLRLGFQPQKIVAENTWTDKFLRSPERARHVSPRQKFTANDRAKKFGETVTTTVQSVGIFPQFDVCSRTRVRTVVTAGAIIAMSASPVDTHFKPRSGVGRVQ